MAVNLDSLHRDKIERYLAVVLSDEPLAVLGHFGKAPRRMRYQLMALLWGRRMYRELKLELALIVHILHFKKPLEEWPSVPRRDR